MIAAPADLSPAERLALCPPAARTELIGSLSAAEVVALEWDWRFWARPKQLPPEGDWLVWLVMAGRGWGKTRTGAQWIHQRAMEGPAREMILISKTPADARDDMIEGVGGILKNTPGHERPTYEPSKRRLAWPNGSTARVRSGADPDGARGFSGDTAWCDELAVWQYPRETWENLLLGMREAKVSAPRVLVTTTPKPIRLLKEIIASPFTAAATGSSYENRSNLSELYYRAVIAPLENTSLGQQEIHARLLDEMPGALWLRATIEAGRVASRVLVPGLTRVVVAVDPATTDTEESSETGILVCALGRDGHGYVLEDASLRASPDGWARRVALAYREHKADRIVAEANQGGDMVSHTLRTVDPTLPIRQVHASRGKEVRAEPIAAMYEQGKIHHVGAFPELEDQLCTWRPGHKSPDRLDALVWAFTDLFASSPERAYAGMTTMGNAEFVAPSGWLVE